jgi:hypothetical protein
MSVRYVPPTLKRYFTTSEPNLSSRFALTNCPGAVHTSNNPIANIQHTRIGHFGHHNQQFRRKHDNLWQIYLFTFC